MWVGIKYINYSQFLEIFRKMSYDELKEFSVKRIIVQLFHTSRKFREISCALQDNFTEK